MMGQTISDCANNRHEHNDSINFGGRSNYNCQNKSIINLSDIADNSEVFIKRRGRKRVKKKIKRL